MAYPPSTPKRQLLGCLNLTKFGLRGCQIVLVGAVLMIAVWAMCMALYYFSQAAAIGG